MAANMGKIVGAVIAITVRRFQLWLKFGKCDCGRDRPRTYHRRIHRIRTGS